MPGSHLGSEKTEQECQHPTIRRGSSDLTVMGWAPARAVPATFKTPQGILAHLRKIGAGEPD